MTRASPSDPPSLVWGGVEIGLGSSALLLLLNIIISALGLVALVLL